MINECIRLLRTLFLSAGFCVSALPVYAQILPPPRHQARSDTGINARDGSFSFEEEDLSIGGEGATGLKLIRSYNSSTISISDPYTSAAGWSSSYDIYLTISSLPRYPGIDYPQYGSPPQYIEECIYNISGGPKSVGFYYNGGGRALYQTGCGPYIGSYVPMSSAGSSLEFLNMGGAYRYRFTSSDGAVINFSVASIPRATDLTYPDGTRLDFSYDGGGKLKAVFSSRGWALLFESATKACAVNTALIYVTPTSACPSTSQTVTYEYANGAYNSAGKLLTSRTRNGETRQYLYADNDHVNCIKDPGQATCRIQNSYRHCPEDPAKGAVQTAVRALDPVTSQTDASGRTYSFAYSEDRCPWSESYAQQNDDYRPFNSSSVTRTESGVSGHWVIDVDPSGNATGFTDPSGYAVSYGYQPPNAATTGYQYPVESGELDSEMLPQGNAFNWSNRDARGNSLSSIASAKPGSGQSNLTQTAVYPSNCTNRLTCNKPTSTTDTRGGVTNFTYDPAHGGVLTETGPADANGVRPVKRFSYVQRSAWLKNGSGGHSASPYSVWLLAEMRTCRTSATVGNVCAGGSADEIVTTYDYGLNSGPNNLLLRGVAVTAGGTTRRTCYGYDTDGRKISETSPMAALGNCP